MEKHTAQFAILAVLMFSAIGILTLYYTQPFDADFNFSDKIDYASIEVETDQVDGSFYGDSIEHLVSAEAAVGSVELDNNGYFTRLYTLPNVVGCINLADSVDETSILLRENQFTVEYRSEGSRKYAGQKVSVPVDKEQSMKLVGVYRPYNIPISQFSSNNIESISVYILEHGEDNPIGIDYGRRCYFHAVQCRTHRRRCQARLQAHQAR